MEQKMQSPFNHLLNKEMDRREFLIHLGAGFIAVLGLSSIVKAFTSGGSRQETTHTPNRSSGYGTSAYGR
jgi:hypothetical protein